MTLTSFGMRNFTVRSATANTVTVTVPVHAFDTWTYDANGQILLFVFVFVSSSIYVSIYLFLYLFITLFIYISLYFYFSTSVWVCSLSLSLSHLYMSLRCCREDAVVAGVTRAVIYVPDPDPDMDLVFEPNVIHFRLSSPQRFVVACFATTAAFGLIILLVESKMNWNWNLKIPTAWHATKVVLK